MENNIYKSKYFLSENILQQNIDIPIGGHSLALVYSILSEYDLQGAKSMDQQTSMRHVVAAVLSKNLTN